MISTSQTREEEFEEVRHGIQNAAAEVGEIRASIQQQTNIIQASTFNISSTLETMQCYQQNHLPELKDLIETLPERIDKRLDLRFDELLLNSQLNKFQSAIAMQKNPVSRIMLGTSNAKFNQGSIFPSEVDRDTKSSASCL